MGHLNRLMSHPQVTIRYVVFLSGTMVFLSGTMVFLCGTNQS